MKLKRNKLYTLKNNKILSSKLPMLDSNLNKKIIFTKLRWNILIKHKIKGNYIYRFNLYYFLLFLQFMKPITPLIAITNNYITRFKPLQSIKGLKNNFKMVLLLQLKSMNNSNPLLKKLYKKNFNTSSSFNNLIKHTMFQIKQYSLKKKNVFLKKRVYSSFLYINWYCHNKIKKKYISCFQNILFEKLSNTLNLKKFKFKVLELKNAFLPLKVNNKKKKIINKWNQIKLFTHKYINKFITFYNNIVLHKSTLNKFNILATYNKKILIQLKEILVSIIHNKIKINKLYPIFYPLLYCIQNIVSIKPFLNLLYYINLLTLNNINLIQSTYMYQIYLKLMMFRNNYKKTSLLYNIHNNINTIHIFTPNAFLNIENQATTYALTKMAKKNIASFLMNYKFLVQTNQIMNAFFFLYSSQCTSLLAKQNYISRFNIKMILYNYYVVKFKFMNLNLTTSQFKSKLVMASLFFKKYLFYLKDINKTRIHIYLLIYKLNYLMCLLYLKKYNVSLYLMNILYLILNLKYVSILVKNLNTINTKNGSSFNINILISTYLNFLLSNFRKKLSYNLIHTLAASNDSFKILKTMTLYRNYILKNKLKFLQYKQYNFYLTKKTTKSIYKNNFIFENSYFLKKKIAFFKKFKKAIFLPKRNVFKKYAFFKKHVTTLSYILHPLPKVIIRMNKRNCFITVSNYDSTTIRTFSLVNLVLRKKVRQLVMQLSFLQVRFFIGFFIFLKVISLN